MHVHKLYGHIYVYVVTCACIWGALIGCSSLGADFQIWCPTSLETRLAGQQAQVSSSPVQELQEYITKSGCLYVHSCAVRTLLWYFPNPSFGKAKIYSKIFFASFFIGLDFFLKVGFILLW